MVCLWGGSHQRASIRGDSPAIKHDSKRRGPEQIYSVQAGLIHNRLCPEQIYSVQADRSVKGAVFVAERFCYMVDLHVNRQVGNMRGLCSGKVLLHDRSASIDRSVKGAVSVAERFCYVIALDQQTDR